jgi:hypothetical protein
LLADLVALRIGILMRPVRGLGTDLEGATLPEAVDCKTGEFTALVFQAGEWFQFG